MICGSCRREKHLACSQVECKCACGNQPLGPKGKATKPPEGLPLDAYPYTPAEKIAAEVASKEADKRAIGSMTDGAVSAELVVTIERIAFVAERFTVAAAAEGDNYQGRKFLDLAERLQKAARLVLTGKTE
jgi:hypothetical protein